jgi:glycosyltransferase involved in cell wall biosynthesis
MTKTTNDKRPTSILTAYPLTREYKARIADLTGSEAIWLTIAELRQMGISAMFRYLRSLKTDRVLIAIDGHDSQALLPILKIIAGAIPSRETFVVNEAAKLTPVSKLETAKSTIRLVFASVTAHNCARRAAKDAGILLTASRTTFELPSTRDVLYLNANLWFGVKAGGSVGHISGVINGLLDAGYKVDFLSAGGRLLTREAVRYVELKPPAHFGLPWEKNSYRFNYDAAAQALEHAEKHPPAFIYQRLSICNFSGVLASRKLKVPLVLEYNGSEAWVAKNWGRPLRDQALAERVEDVNLRHAHLLVTISDVLRDELIDRGVEPNRIVTYPNCIDPAVFDPACFSAKEIVELRKRYNIAADSVVISFLGTFGQWHGAPVLAEAARKILDEHAQTATRHKLHFLFVGDGIRMPEVKAALGRHASGPHVTLAGLVAQDKAPLYLAASDILASPHVPNADGSRFFGSPTKLFEYMGMGKAILASDLDQIGQVLDGSIVVGGLPTGLPTGDAPALLARPGSADEIIQGILFLAENTAWRKALGQNARARALTKYTWRHHVEAILDRAVELGLIAQSPRRA